MLKDHIITGVMLIVISAASVAFAGAYTITNSTDIWVGGIVANGKDIIDPHGNANIDKEYGNISSATINADSRRYVWGMDTADFVTGAAGSGVGPTSISMTEEVSGENLTITMGSFQNLQGYALGQATSSSNSLNIGYYNYRNMTFDRAVEAAGFTICRIDQPNLTAYFYSDITKTNLLASYDILNNGEGDAPDFRYTGFVAHTDTNVGIRCVELLRPDHSGGSILLDDIAVILPRTMHGTLIIIK